MVTHYAGETKKEPHASVATHHPVDGAESQQEALRKGRTEAIVHIANLLPPPNLQQHGHEHLHLLASEPLPLSADSLPRLSAVFPTVPHTPPHLQQHGDERLNL